MYDSSEVLNTGTGIVTTTVEDDIITGEKIIESISDIDDRVRKKLITLVKGEGSSVNYAVQAGNGGFTLLNSSTIIGNIHSSGEVNGASNVIDGTVISSGPDGLVDGVEVTGNVYANVIDNTMADGDAYYMTIIDSTIGGVEYPDSPDQDPASFPISDELIDEWKQIAEDAEVVVL